jgi:hypothetical protein
VLVNVKQVTATRTPQDRTPRAGARNCIAVLQRVLTVVMGLTWDARSRSLPE